jgi:hypothetical protein
MFRNNSGITIEIDKCKLKLYFDFCANQILLNFHHDVLYAIFVHSAENCDLPAVVISFGGGSI